jgi:iron complex outermembrane receptor protein
MAPLSNVTVDAFARYVAELPRPQVPSYTELNLRLGWRPMPGLEVALVGADLLDDSHAEAGTAPSSTNPNPPPPQTEIERAVWLDVIWQWQ